MPSVLLVDDDANILSALRRELVPVLPRDYVIEVFTDPLAALERARKVEFDVAVVDYRMPGMDGVEVLRALRERSPSTVRLMLSGVSDFGVILNAVNSAQIFHYVCKPWEPEQLREVFRMALEHRKTIARAHTDEPVDDDTQARLASLTAREREVMHLMVAGKPSKVIARELGISARTVENHRARVMEKSGASSLTDLVRMSLQRN